MSSLGSVFRFTPKQNFIKLDFRYTLSKQFTDFVKKTGFVMSGQLVHDLIVSAIGPAWKQAVAKAPYDTGFLRDHIFVYMTSNTEGWLVSEADYSKAQEDGYRNKRGNWVNGRHFMRPAAMVAKKQIELNMKYLQECFVKGIKAQFRAAGVTVKQGYPSVARKPSRSGFQRQTTAMKRPRYQSFSGVFHVARKRVQKFGLFGRTTPRQVTGGRR